MEAEISRARARDWHTSLAEARTGLKEGVDTPEGLARLAKAFHNLAGMANFYLPGNGGAAWASRELERAQHNAASTPSADNLELILDLFALHGPSLDVEIALPVVPPPDPLPQPPANPAVAQEQARAAGAFAAASRAFPTISIAPPPVTRASAAARREHYADAIRDCEERILPCLERAQNHAEQNHHLHDLKGVGGSVFDEAPAIVQHVWNMPWGTIERRDAIEKIVHSFRVALRSVEEAPEDAKGLINRLAQHIGVNVERETAPAAKAVGDAPQPVQIRLAALDDLADHALDLTQFIGRLEWLSRQGGESSPALQRLAAVSKALRERDYSSPSTTPHAAIASSLELHKGSPLMELAVAVEEAAASLRQEIETTRRDRAESRQTIDRAVRSVGAMRAEMVDLRTQSWESLALPFEAEVERTAARQHRSVRLEIAGGDTRIEKRYASLLRSVLTHLLSNAVCHGVEEVRPSDKDPIATVTLRADKRSSGTVIVSVEDDGGGIDLDRIRQRADEKGLALPPKLKSWSEVIDPNAVLRCLFERDFSTKAGTQDPDSGKGLGLAQVRERVEAARGEIFIETKLGSFTRFYLRLPVHHDAMDVIPIEVGGQPYYLRADLVLSEIDCPPLPSWEGGLNPLHQMADPDTGELVDVLPLDRALGFASQAQGKLLRMREGPLLGIARVLGGARQVTIRSLDSVCAVDPWAGTALADDGRVALLLDVFKLNELREKGQLPLRVQRELGGRSRTPQARVLVVDDMPSVRERVSQVLTQMGHEPVTASNGLDAWKIFDADPHQFQLVVTDLEMPSMDGYALIQAIRQSAICPNVPICVLTGRSAGTHRDQARRLGASTMLIKPVRSDELRLTLHSLLSAKTFLPA